jgi:hypothetical protein
MRVNPTGNMNCLLEAAASLWLGGRRRVMTEPPEEEVMSAQDGLEQCRRNMEGRERELQGIAIRLASEALAKRKQGDALMARSKLMERRRVMKRLERLRQGLELVDTQLDAIKSSELDKEIMLTLKASTNAMRKAGINLGIQEVESVMSELDEQMREAQDVTSVLSNPLILTGQQAGTSGVQLEDADLDAELDLLEAAGGNSELDTSLNTTKVGMRTHGMIKDASLIIAPYHSPAAPAPSVVMQSPEQANSQNLLIDNAAAE